MKMILSFRMAEAQFIKALTGYFGFPLIITVAFVLLMFWICRYFNNNAQYQQNAQQGRAPPPLPMRNIQNAIVTALFLAYPIFVVAAEETTSLTAYNNETLPENSISNRGLDLQNRGQKRTNHTNPESGFRQALRNEQKTLSAMIIPHWIILFIGTGAMFIAAATTLVCILNGTHSIKNNSPHPGEESGHQTPHPGEESGRTSYLRSSTTN